MKMASRQRTGSGIFFSPSTGETAFLSNSFVHEVTSGRNVICVPFQIDHVPWRSVDHYYACQKVNDPKLREDMRHIDDPYYVRELGRLLKPEDKVRDWTAERKLELMRKALKVKFEDRPVLTDLLLSTGDAVLHNDNDDLFWGYAEGKGEDRLGKMLMGMRDKLRRERLKKAKR